MANNPATSTDGGIAAALDGGNLVVYRVSPNTEPTDSGSVRAFLRPVACLRIDDGRFDFDSSFVLPDASKEFALLAARRPVAGKTLLSVFGHADPVSDDDYNKELSTRRAKALYALLVRDVDLWEELFQVSHGGDVWGYRHICLMLNEIGFPTPVVTAPNAASRQVVRNFQDANGLNDSGEADKSTRSMLFASYMDAVCLDGSGVTFQYQKSDFLSRNVNGTPQGVPDYQGCGEFNPVFVFSQQNDKDLSDPKRKAERNLANSSNRRVVVYVFPEDVKFPVDRWPCPAKGTGGCRKQFWKDGDKRRKPQERDRQYLMTNDTFACKFYDRIVRSSPCEAVRQALNVFLKDEAGKALPNAPYRLTVDTDVREGNANADGVLVEEDVYLGNTAFLEWGEVPEDQRFDPDLKLFAFRRQIFLDVDRDDPGVVDRQLHNLALTEGTRDEKLAQFREQRLLQSGQDATLNELASVTFGGTDRPVET
jgi:hypothetical protein